MALVEVERREGLAIVALNRPEARNAIDDAMREELRTIIGELAEDPDTLGVVLTGRGSAFCAGGDIKAMRERLETSIGVVATNGWQRQRRTFALTATVHTFPLPTIAAVNGPAAGLGMDLALACDFVIVDSGAMFIASFVERALVSDGGGMYYLPRRVGLSVAKQLLFSGRRINAEEAVALGVADLLAESGDVVNAACSFAQAFVNQPRTSLMLMKSILNSSFESSLDQIGSLGSQAQAICYTTTDHRASVERFLDRSSMGRDAR